MLAMAQCFWRDEDGLILSAELVMILTIGVLGLIVGLVNLQNAILGEMNDLSGAFRSLNQSFATPSFTGCWKNCAPTSFTIGSCFVDVYEPCYLNSETCVNGSAGCAGLELNSCYGCYQPGTGVQGAVSVPQAPGTATDSTTNRPGPSTPPVDQNLPQRTQPAAADTTK